MLDFRAPFRAPAFFVHGKRGQKSGSRVKLKPLPYMLSLKLFPWCVLDFESCEPGCLVTGLLLGYWVVARLLGQRSSIFSRLSIISAVNWSFFPPFSSTGVRFFRKISPSIFSRGVGQGGKGRNISCSIL